MNARTRLLFARKVKCIPSRDFWTNEIGFYFDGVSWTLIHVTKPDQLLRWYGVKNQRVWHSNAPQKEGSGGKMVKVFVAIACGHEAVLCEQYEEQLTGQFFADFVKEHFENAFENSSKPRGKLLIPAGWRPQSEFFESKESYS